MPCGTTRCHEPVHEIVAMDENVGLYTKADYKYYIEHACVYIHMWGYTYTRTYSI